MPIYLRREAKERPMHDQDPWDSPKLAAADLTEVAGMMRRPVGPGGERGRPCRLTARPTRARTWMPSPGRLQQIADHFDDGRKLIRTGQTKEQATPKAKAKPPSAKALIG